MTQLSEILKHKIIAIDTETTGLKRKLDKPFGISLSTKDKDYYWDLRENPSAPKLIQTIVDSPDIETIIFHNAPFDYHMLEEVDVTVPLSKIHDTIIRARLINETLAWGLGSYSLDYLASTYLGVSKYNEVYEELAEIFGGAATRNKQMPNVALAPSSVIEPYAKRDTRLTYDLFIWQNDEIEKQELQKIYSFERQVQQALIDIERGGIKVDINKAEEAKQELTDIINKDFERLKGIIDRDINVNSSAQIRDLFKPTKNRDGYWTVATGGEPVVVATTKTGNPSLGQADLLNIGTPEAELIADLRTNIKARDTYIQKFIIDGAVDGMLYPTWNQILDTGRLSIRNPSMQNIPVRSKQVSEVIKRLFLPDDKQEWVDCDLSSNEVRVFAHLASKYDDRLVKEYAKNPHLDLHQYVADLTGLPRNPVKGGGTGNGKQLNLSAIFNQGRGAAADKMGLDWSWDGFLQRGKLIKYKKAGKEANEIIDKYHARVGGVKELAEDCEREAKRMGYITTALGRRIRFPKQQKTYKASGMLIQATAADINKQILLFAHRTAKEHGGRVLINIHDSYSLSLPPKSASSVIKKLADEVQFPQHRSATRVPLILELTGRGKNWWQAVGKPATTSK